MVAPRAAAGRHRIATARFAAPARPDAGARGPCLRGLALGDARCDGAMLIVSQPADPDLPCERVFERLIADASSARHAHPSYDDDIAFWLYSSGSTGRPKGTVHTHANLHWTAELYAKPILGIGADDIVFSAAKLFFAFGLGNALTVPLSVGATTVLMAERPTAHAVYRRLRAHRPTIFCGVPTLYASMLADADRDDFRCDILDGLGSTEMLHIFVSNVPGAVEYGTTGRPVPGYEVALRDDDGLRVPDGESGDLYIKGPSAALMYWTNREKSRATFLGDWMRSGDKYRRLPNGCYVYAGRSDDMLKVSGQYVLPIEVEMVLCQHDAVLEAGVAGIERDGLVKTRAFVVLKHRAPDPALADELRAFVKARLAPHKYPREIVFVDQLPKTATGKIQRFKLREQLA